MELQATASANPKNHYEALGMLGLEQDGSAKMWWFDSWGASAVATGTGTLQNNQLVMHDSNAEFKEERSFQTNGNEMTMHAKGTMNMQGKDMPFDQTVVYKKVRL